MSRFTTIDDLKKDIWLAKNYMKNYAEGEVNYVAMGLGAYSRFKEERLASMSCDLNSIEGFPVMVSSFIPFNDFEILSKIKPMRFP